MSTTYQYEPLNPDNHEIRLVELAPGSFDAPLVIHLRLVTIPPGIEIHKDGALSAIEDYEALSYAWGSEESRTVQVDDKDMHIRVNLEHALRHLRYLNRKRVLWVDALSINQDDIAERNSQVALMRLIYSSASVVAIWLGIGEKDDEQVIRDMTWPPYPPMERAQYFEAIARICTRSWFSRIWVVQELIFANADPVVYLGAVSISWDVFRKAITKTDLATLNPPEAPTAVPRRYRRATTHLKALARMRDERASASFGESLVFTAPLGASDPRDKIFAILGLQSFSTQDVELMPDYTKTSREVFVETATLLIRDDALSLYGRLPLQPVREFGVTNLVDVPTWVVDPTINTQSGTYEYSYNWPKRPIVYKNVATPAFKTRRFRSLSDIYPNDILRTVGKLIGVITNVSGTIMRDAGSYPDRSATIRNICRDFLEPQGISPKALMGALWAARDHNLTHYTFYQQRFSERGDNTRGENHLTERQCHMLANLSESACDKIIFTTSTGRVGLAYHPDVATGIRPNDIVVGLFDLNLPFVLRKAELENHYQMVNVAYINEHAWFHPALESTPDGTTEAHIWQNLDEYGLEEFRII
jgi:hypothetical protein